MNCSDLSEQEANKYKNNRTLIRLVGTGSNTMKKCTNPAFEKQRCVSPVQAAVAKRQATSEPQTHRQSNTATPPASQAKPSHRMAYVAQKNEPVRNTAGFS